MDEYLRSFQYIHTCKGIVGREGSYTRLDRLLTDSVEGAKMRTQLRTINLPIHEEKNNSKIREDRKWLQDGRVFDCSAAIQFSSHEDGTKEPKLLLPRKIIVIGYLGNHVLGEMSTYGTPTSMVHRSIGTIGVESSRIDRLLLRGLWGHEEQLTRRYNNPFVDFGLHCPYKRMWLTELYLQDFHCRFLSAAMPMSMRVPSLKTLTFRQCTAISLFLE
jgi:hypothetical protein